jgi:hypothetical protein
VQYVTHLKRGDWATSLIWGRNHVSEPGATRNLNGYTFESTVNFIDRNYLYTRLELVDRDELLRAGERRIAGHQRQSSDLPHWRVAYTVGYVRDVFDNDDWSVGVGGDLTAYSKPDVLDQLYGAHPTSFRLFLRVRPGRMKMDRMMDEGHDAGMKHEH